MLTDEERSEAVKMLSEAIAASGLSVRKYAADVLVRDEQTVRHWLKGEWSIPEAVVVYLHRQVAKKRLAP